MDQWLRDSMLPLQGAQGVKERNKEKKCGRGWWVLSWAFRGPSGLYFILETETTEKFMHEGLRSDLPLEAAYATREQ